MQIYVVHVDGVIHLTGSSSDADCGYTLDDIGQIYEISLYHVFLKSERHMPVAKIIVFCNNIRYNFSEKRTYLLWMIWIRMIDRNFYR